MSRHGRPRKRFGQHFLTDQAVVERIFAALRLTKEEVVLEIGPGTGALTERLCQEAGDVQAIEIDRDLARQLSHRFPALALTCADVLTVDLADLLDAGAARRDSDAHLARRRTRVVGNLPYNVATPLLGRLFPLAGRCFDMHFMLQAEVASRLTARPGDKAYGRLSVLGQYHCSIDALFDVEPTSFAPPPKVRSTFVRLTGRAASSCDVEILQRVTRIAFGQRRKTLGNGLKSLALDWQALAIDPGLRPEALRVDDFVKIANALERSQA